MKETAKSLREKKRLVAVAESCTGGLVSHLLTNMPGCSDYFLGGIVAYGNGMKIRLLGVDEKLITDFGAVSKEVATQMAYGVRIKMGADIGIGVTGIAGPSGGSMAKPVGLVYIAANTDSQSFVLKNEFKGSRVSVKRQSAGIALSLLRRAVESFR